VTSAGWSSAASADAEMKDEDRADVSCRQICRYDYGGRCRWHTARQGYLTEPMYGYALARYARLRGEAKPAWAAHLDTNPRIHLKKSLR
jgi:hypothetical protein